jgi:hypothetical protein
MSAPGYRRRRELRAGKSRGRTRMQQLFLKKLLRDLTVGKRGKWSAKVNVFTARAKMKEVGAAGRKELENEILEKLKSVRTEGTEGQYVSAVRAYVTYCKGMACPLTKSDDDHFARYVMWRYRTGARGETIAKDFTKLRCKLAEVGIEVPLLEELKMTRMVLKSLVKEDNVKRPKTKRHPITTVHLRDLVGELMADSSISKEEKVLFRALYVCMFFGFLRVSEAIRGGAGKCRNPPLQRKHVCFMRNKVNGKRMVVITLPPTKTDQSGNEQEFKLALGELEEGDKLICPYDALLELVKLQGANADPATDLFSLPAFKLRPKYRPFVTRIRVLLSRAGHVGTRFFSHSFRIGAATSALMLGFSKRRIKTLGRWRSECWHIYARKDLGFQAVCTANLEKLTERILM